MAHPPAALLRPPANRQQHLPLAQRVRLRLRDDASASVPLRGRGRLHMPPGASSVNPDYTANSTTPRALGLLAGGGFA
eukprot:4125122-Pyramimonas_sp.AAC.3